MNMTLHKFIETSPLGTVWKDDSNGLWLSKNLLRYLQNARPEYLKEEICMFDGEVYFTANTEHAFFRRCPYQPMKKRLGFAEWPIKVRGL